MIVQQTSTLGEHPKVVAQSTKPGLKLIGGGPRSITVEAQETY